MELWKIIYEDDLNIRGSISIEALDKYHAIELFEQLQQQTYINESRYLIKLAMFLVE